uniref:Uncharacterized protein n=1 Tax=Cacopsylla melanoneura TaxID=428564 RepID=A0A8D9E548_9HEMI
MFSIFIDQDQNGLTLPQSIVSCIQHVLWLCTRRHFVLVHMLNPMIEHKILDLSKTLKYGIGFVAKFEIKHHCLLSITLLLMSFCLFTLCPLTRLPPKCS